MDRNTFSSNLQIDIFIRKKDRIGKAIANPKNKDGRNNWHQNLVGGFERTKLVKAPYPVLLFPPPPPAPAPLPYRHTPSYAPDMIC